MEMVECTIMIYCFISPCCDYRWSKWHW